MTEIGNLVAALFLPLFPLSLVFVRLFATPNAMLRIVLLLLWPQLGVLTTSLVGEAPQSWILYWAVLTSALYALRALALRDLGLWIGFVAVSSWSLLWLLWLHGVDTLSLHLYAFGFSAPLALLALLAAWLERRFGAAYTGLFGGLAQTLPRFSSVLVLVVLAVVATPLFPSFAAMLAVLNAALPVAPLAALLVGAVWLLWTWAGSRLLQGLIVGPASDEYQSEDLALTWSWGFGITLLLLAAGGIYLIGGVV